MFDNPTDAAYLRRIATVFFMSFVLIAIVSNLIGAERKALWFKKRTKYSIFTRRSVLGEFIHFGRPCTREGFLLALGIFCFIFSFGYWYIFIF